MYALVLCPSPLLLQNVLSTNNCNEDQNIIAIVVSESGCIASPSKAQQTYTLPA
jgi:hypothetical protein